MSHSAFGLGAVTGALPVLIGLTWILVRSCRRGGTAYEAYRAAFEQSTESVLLVDAHTLQIVDANRSLQRITSYTQREIRSLPLEQLLIDSSGEAGALLKKLDDPGGEPPAGVQQRSKDGKLRDVEVSGHPVDLGKRRLLALTVSDPAIRRKGLARQLLEHQSRLHHLAHHDQLTGLPNRLLLAAHLPGALEEARRTGALLAVLLLDLDRFQHINDSCGHETGDKLLRVVAERLRGAVRAPDMVVRMGGDEFIVVLKSAQSIESVNEIAGQISETIANAVLVDGRPLVTTVSIGISLYPRDGADACHLLRNADTAMDQAKEHGRNQIQHYCPAMGQRLAERVGIEASLRTALPSGQLDVYYQPIVDVHSHRIVALESLLRWTHPTHGVVHPERFIPVAEDSGLIVPMGEFVLERTIEDLARWREAGCLRVPVAVNVSAVQLQRSDLPETISRMTRQRGVDPGMLQAELTESAVFDRESNVDALRRLRELGVHIAIDDFGTGYSSLSYLKRWRVDSLKIDRSFVRDLVTDTSDLAIVGAIISMARHLNIGVVAEGIEEWPQLEKLRQLGCPLAQGFLFAKPVSAEQCERYLSGRPLALAELGSSGT